MAGRRGMIVMGLLLAAAVGALTRSLWWPSPPEPQSRSTPTASVAPTAAEPAPTEVAEPVQQSPGEAQQGSHTEPAEQPAPAVEDEAGKTRFQVLAASMRSDSFRVRTRAVLSLAKMNTPLARKLVRDALNDPHPGVRKAAQEALRPQPRSQQKGEPNPTPTPGPSTGGGGYYVHLGPPAARGLSLSPGVMASVGDALRQKVGAIPLVRLAPDSESSAAAKAAVSRGGRTGYHLDVSITKLEQTPTGGTRAQVSVVVQTYPGRDMRAIIGGAATVQGSATGDAAAQMAIAGAIQSAARKLPQAFSRFAN